MCGCCCPPLEARPYDAKYYDRGVWVWLRVRVRVRVWERVRVRVRVRVWVRVRVRVWVWVWVWVTGEGDDMMTQQVRSAISGHRCRHRL